MKTIKLMSLDQNQRKWWHSNIGSNKVRLLAFKTIAIVSIIISAAIKYSQRQMAVQCEIFMHGPKSGTIWTSRSWGNVPKPPSSTAPTWQSK